MNLWIPGRDWYGWKLSKMSYDTYLNAGLGEGSDKFSFGSYEEDNAQSKMKSVPRLFKQMKVLSLLFCDNKPYL